MPPSPSSRDIDDTSSMNRLSQIEVSPSDVDQAPSTTQSTKEESSHADDNDSEEFPNSDWMETNPGYQQLNNVMKLYTRRYWQASMDFRAGKFERSWDTAFKLYMKPDLSRYLRVETLQLLANLVPSKAASWMKEAMEVCDTMDTFKSTAMEQKTIDEKRALCHKILARFDNAEYADGTKDRVQHQHLAVEETRVARA